jgi:hypothetical protein
MFKTAALNKACTAKNCKIFSLFWFESLEEGETTSDKKLTIDNNSELESKRKKKHSLKILQINKKNH